MHNQKTSSYSKSFKLAGVDLIQIQQEQLSHIRAELIGFATLFKSLNNDVPLDNKALYGVGLTLNRVANRIGKISDKLEQLLASEPSA